jgi:hypothetical protein
MTIRIDGQMNKREIKRSRDVEIMSVSKRFFILLILSVSTAPIFASEALAVDGENVVVSAIDRAEIAMVSAYEAVLDAEQAGANASGLLARLNVAGEYLADAHIWYELGDYDNATHFANLCYDIGEDVRNEAFKLKNEAHGLWVSDLWMTITISIIGVVSVVFLSFLGWRTFKRHYHKRVLIFSLL